MALVQFSKVLAISEKIIGLRYNSDNALFEAGVLPSIRLPVKIWRQ